METKRIICLLVAALSCVKCSEQKTEVYNSTRFSVEFYKSFVNVQENQVLSPFAFRILLAIVYQVAYGESENELREHLYYSDKETTATEHDKLLLEIRNRDGIQIITKSYIKNQVVVNANFKQTINRYHSEYENVDFTDKLGTADKINNWINGVSHGLIQNLVSPETLHPRTVLLLANSLYFKAQWDEPFSDDTVRGDFTTIIGDVVTIDFMSGRVRGNSANLPNAIVLELKYKPNIDFVFWIFLPNEQTTLLDFIKSLKGTTFADTKNSFQQDELDVYIPVFEIETLVDGVEEFNKYGVSKIFESFEFNLLESGSGLRIDQLTQKTLIRVNTNGTEACSVSYLQIQTRTDAPLFDANRPFVYAIVRQDTAEPIFIGHYSNPNT